MIIIIRLPLMSISVHIRITLISIVLTTVVIVKNSVDTQATGE